MNILVIPDVHLKGWMFDRATELMNYGMAEKTVCLMDLPDEWGHGNDLDLYAKTFDKAIEFAKRFPETLWCYGNHDLSYVWLQPESGFSMSAVPTVISKLTEFRNSLSDSSKLAYIHRIDNVLFTHGGLTDAFVRNYAPDIEHRDTDEILKRINALGFMEIWDDASPIWFRPQYYNEEMYRETDMLQVVGHTPVKELGRTGTILSCDLFSTYRDGEPIGTKEFVLLDTETWDYQGIK